MSQRSSGSQRTPVTEDERLLAQVPRERRAFVKTDSWRVLRIMGEFVEGFDTLSDVYNAVTVFGSARTTPEDPYYEKAVETGRMLAQEGFPIITGGGPGIMEAANRGAQEGNGLSIGCNIELPFEQGLNPTSNAPSTSVTFSSARRCSSSTRPRSSCSREDTGRWTSCSRRSR